MSVDVGTLVPELVLSDPEAGRRWLEAVLGFRHEDGVLRLGNQTLLVAKESPAERHGWVDHLALAVPDLAAALTEALGRGARLGPATPDGPLSIREFSTQGVSYAFVEGPEGANIELIAPLDAGARHGPGHDHIGLPCPALGPMRAFLLDLGGVETSSHVLRRPTGDVEVCFLRLGSSVAEIYSPRGMRAGFEVRPGSGFWRLRMAGLDAPRKGPGGVEVLPL